MSLRLWKEMGNAIDWTALPVLVELYGIDDPEPVIRQLLTIRSVIENERELRGK